jgi:hypothetical protein
MKFRCALGALSVAVMLPGQVDHLEALLPLSRARYIAHVRSMFTLLQ